MQSIICFGEVLWDVLPSGRKLGGAPLNVSLRAKSFGNRVRMISSIGRDRIGQELAAELKAHGGSLEHIQVTEEYATSEVLVTLDSQGSATYEIKMPCAWDAIRLLDRDMELVKSSDAFIYGSLVARSSTSRKTLLALLEHASFKVFDVNLRPPHYTMESVTELMRVADFVKFNDEELFEICADQGFTDQNLEKAMAFMAQLTGTEQICVTLGKDGAVLYADSVYHYHKGYQVEVADTVGAGDSFLASIVSQLLRGRTPGESLDFACAVGAIVASKQGANPAVSEAEITAMRNT